MVNKRGHSAFELNEFLFVELTEENAVLGMITEAMQ
jgi:hypothetical protein